MSSPDPSLPAQPVVIAWYRSQALQVLAVSIISQILSILHLSKYVTSAQLAQLVDATFQVIALVAAIRAAQLRITKPGSPPVALNQRRADNANAAAPVPPVIQPPKE